MIGVHLTLAAVSNTLAFLLRFGGEIDGDGERQLFMGLPALLVVRGVTFHWFRLHESLWRYSSVWDLKKIVFAVALSSGTFSLLT